MEYKLSRSPRPSAESEPAPVADPDDDDGTYGFDPFDHMDGADPTVRIPAATVETMRQQPILTLRVVAGPDMLRFHTLAVGERVLVGRDDTADLRLSDSTVSKQHAVFEADATGTVLVIDQRSTNGTRVNNRSVQRTRLRVGDQLELGNVLLQLDALTMEELYHLGQVVSRLESAQRDPLTGLLTRAFLDQGLADLIARSDQAGIPISFAFIDIDHFKKVNDTYGHQTGDQVLSAVSRLLMLHIRDGDPAVRYGGEELLLVLPGSDSRSAQHIAERIRTEVEAHDWHRDAKGLRVTISTGIAQRRPHEAPPDVIRRADEAMYAAKKSGRNRVVVAR